MATEDSRVLTVALIFPELLGTYGDGGNARVLVERARQRGIDANLVVVGVGEEVPSATLFVLGGGEDGPQGLAADQLRVSSFASRVEDGSFVVAVCAGLQILGTTFCVEGRDDYPGLNLVDAVTRRAKKRAVGELAVRVKGKALVGFENHGGTTTLGAGVTPLGEVLRGRGNDGKVDGFVAERVWATYAHGPVLALNPWWADEILGAVLGVSLEPLVTVADDLYEERRGALKV